MPPDAVCVHAASTTTRAAEAKRATPADPTTEARSLRRDELAVQRLVEPRAALPAVVDAHQALAERVERRARRERGEAAAHRGEQRVRRRLVEDDAGARLEARVDVDDRVGEPAD